MLRKVSLNIYVPYVVLFSQIMLKVSQIMPFLILAPNSKEENQRQCATEWEDKTKGNDH